MSRIFSPLPGLALFTLFAGALVGTGACSGDPTVGGGSDKDDGDRTASGASGNDGSGSDSDGLGHGDRDGDADGDGDSDGGGKGPVCETASSEAELAPIYLAFAFDVSGSMGQMDRPRWWHDPTKKWDPVVAATTEFFQDPDSQGISASMTLFPEVQSIRCDSESYESPLPGGVAMTALPSNSFKTRLDAYREGSWRGGTPTLAVIEGTIQFLEPLIEEHPDAKFALVLVTDGLPQDCSSNANKISTVAAAVAEAKDKIPTYVIGIENPTTPPAEKPSGWANWGCNSQGEESGSDRNYPCPRPDTLDALNDIAEAGGTSQAFLIDTDNPEATKTAFRAAIDKIRARAVSCELGIPAHPTPGKKFDKDKINVSKTLAGKKTAFLYDPDCEEGDAWHYDDEENPKKIVLCSATCEQVQSEPGVDLNVDFLCENRPPIVR